MAGHDPLEGTLVALSHPRTDLLECLQATYASLADRHGPENVLVLKRHPAGLQALEDALSNTRSEAVAVPQVDSLPEHASKVIERYDPTLERLEYEERIELISLLIAGASRAIPPYLERAREQDQFARDVGQLLLEATRQQVSTNDDLHPCLEFLYSLNDRFHDELTARGFIERADVIPRAVSLLESNTNDVRTRTVDSIDAVLAVQFEEFRSLDRRYLATVAADCELVCFGQHHASVERTAVEPGSLSSLAPGLDTHRPDTDPPQSPHDPVIRYLSLGTTSLETQPGSETSATENRATPNAYHIDTDTSEAQSRAIATEIAALCDRSGYTPGEFAVAVPSAERVPPVRAALREASIPTATIATPTLADDPAVSELYAVARARRTLEQGGSLGDLEPAIRDRLEARATLEALTATRHRSVTETLDAWIHTTDLKGRIAREANWVDARSQFENVERVRSIAQFVQTTDLVAPNWDGLVRMLARTIEYDAPHVHAVEAETAGEGVMVCPIDALAYDTRPVVFLTDLIEETYPGTTFLTSLFPTAWLRAMDGFPGVTAPTVSQLETTFEPVADGTAVPDRFTRYHLERSRRRLALGARAARDRLYFTTYRRETAGLRRTRAESRFLTTLREAPGIVIETIDPEAPRGVAHGRQQTREAILSEPRAGLEEVLRAASMGHDPDLAVSTERIQEIALLLEDETLDPTLREAIRAQFELAAGDVER